MKKLFWLSVLFATCFGWITSEAYAQDKRKKPLFQPITIKPGKNRPRTVPTPLVKKTSSTKPIRTPASTALRKTSFPILQTISIPGYSGVLIESEKGKVVLDTYSDHAFNPASNVKVATAYVVLSAFGPNFRFKSNVWTDGSIDISTRTLIGNLYISGRDPVFNYEHAVLIANELNRLGIKNVKGDLVVTPKLFDEPQPFDFAFRSFTY